MLRGVDRTPAITVRHLASHTSGLPDFFEKRDPGPSLFEQLAAGRDQAWTFDDVIRMTRGQRPHFEPQDLTATRQRARYSDTGFQLLIRILETVTGQPFADLLAERIVRPLGLTRTWLPGRLPPDPEAPAPSPLHARRRRVELPSLIESSNDLFQHHRRSPRLPAGAARRRALRRRPFTGADHRAAQPAAQRPRPPVRAGHHVLQGQPVHVAGRQARHARRPFGVHRDVALPLPGAGRAPRRHRRPDRGPGHTLPDHGAVPEGLADVTRRLAGSLRMSASRSLVRTGTEGASWYA
ncbi:serine hydrolase domain-containing protein [Nonomuraea ferruginea]